jgi:c-di-AMP phosphodiesterase-like protein
MVQEKEQVQGKGPNFKDHIFVGHNNTDLDSVGSAIGAAELFGGMSDQRFALPVLLMFERI